MTLVHGRIEWSRQIAQLKCRNTTPSGRCTIHQLTGEFGRQAGCVCTQGAYRKRRCATEKSHTSRLGSQAAERAFGLRTAVSISWPSSKPRCMGGAKQQRQVHVVSGSGCRASFVRRIRKRPDFQPVGPGFRCEEARDCLGAVGHRASLALRTCGLDILATERACYRRRTCHLALGFKAAELALPRHRATYLGARSHGAEMPSKNDETDPAST